MKRRFGLRFKWFLKKILLGSKYPSGLLVVQDGTSDPQYAVADEEELENSSTNFKFVPGKMSPMPSPNRS